MDINWGPLARFNFYLQGDIIETNRKTESVFDILGTAGGLLRALTVIVSFFVSPYNKYTLKSLLALNLVRYVPSESSNTRISKRQKEEEFKLKYLDSQSDPKRKNLLQNLILNFSKNLKF